MPAVTQYAERKDLENLGLGETELDGEEVDSDAVDSALESASRVADGYLTSPIGFPLTLPVTTVGSDLRMYVAWIAAYIYKSAQGYSPEAGQDNIYRDRYDDAIKWLTKISSGDITLVGTIGTDPGPPVGSQIALRPVVISGTTRGFSSRGMTEDIPRVMKNDLTPGTPGGFVGD